MKSWAIWLVLVGLVLMGIPTAHSGEESWTGALAPDARGITWTVTGIEGVEAITQAVSGMATGTARMDQALVGNWVAEQQVSRHTLIQHAFRDNHGIMSVNQNAGTLNNQANIRVLALVGAESLVHNLNFRGSASLIDNTLISSGGERDNRIVDSFAGTVGIVGVNQSSGNLNQQANVFVLGLGLLLDPEVVALGDISLGEVGTGNTLTQGPAGPRTDTLASSFADFRGIAQVSQSSGDLNAIGNYLGLSLSVVNVR